MELKESILANISPGELQGYIAVCNDLNVVTQGKTLDNVLYNLQEALLLHLENEDLKELGYVSNPSLLVTLEVQLFV